MKPMQNRIGCCNAWPFGHRRTLDQDDRHTQNAGRIQLRACTRTAGIFGDDMADAMGFQQSKVAVKRKGAARNNRESLGQRQAFWRIHKTQKVMMLGLYGEIFNVLPANGEEDVGRVIGQGGHGCGTVLNHVPLIAGHRLPRLALQRQQRQASNGGRINRMRAHLGGERVGGVDDMGDGLRTQKVGKAGHAAKAADPHRQGLRQRYLGSSGVRENARNTLICKGNRQGRGFGRTAKQKDSGHG